MKVSKISGKIVSHEKLFFGTIEFDEVSGLILDVRERIEGDAHNFSTEDCLIFPGFGDIHVHAREDVSGTHNYKEDFHSASMAALNGGVIHIADMPNNPIPPIDDISYSNKENLAKKAPICITLYAGVGPNTKPLNRKVPYKVFMGPSIGELYFKDNVSLEETIRYYEGLDVSFHCEDPEVLENSKSAFTHEDRRPKNAEILATEFALYLIEKYKLKGKLCHYSTGEGLQKIIRAKQRGVSVTCEVTPTHLYFDKTFLTPENYKWFQMNPPLRDPEDKEALLNALKNGDIDFLATDHAPHSIEEKQKGISGISQLDTFALFVTYLLVTKNVEPTLIAKIASKNPGDFIRPYTPSIYGKGFGLIQKDYSASFSVLNLKKPTLFKKENIKSKSAWSPFEDFTFPGSIESVYFQGKKI
ncbi:MAG: amidohydrolase [Spirochaetia bacterium]|nr:amidohydrolase [Spirochaetia bacterium]